LIQPIDLAGEHARERERRAALHVPAVESRCRPKRSNCEIVLARVGADFDERLEPGIRS
jgi:hypothetical protein